MTNNDVLRSLRYALELDPSTMLRFFAEADVKMTLPTLAALLKSEEEPGFAALPDKLFARFLDGLIAAQRGPREAPSTSVPSKPVRIHNNYVLRSLKIAFELRDVDIIAIMELAGVPLSKPELSALCRREDHRHYRPCGD